MSYGTRPRRKSLDPDPTVIPSTSALGFLGRLPFKLGGTLRYKPSAADLQEHPGARGTEIREEDEGEPLMGDHDEDERDGRKGHTRNRSSTASSGETSDSFRSRGDLFPSDGEDDAVPLDDEFAMVLERRMTNTADDRSSGKTRSSKGKRPSGSRNVSRTMSRTNLSSQSRPGVGRTNSSSQTYTPDIASPGLVEAPSLTALQQEDERVRHEEEQEVERKRQAAAKLAMERGLHAGEGSEATITEAKIEPPEVDNIETEIPHPQERVDVTVQPDEEYSEPGPIIPPVATKVDKENQPPVQDEEFVPARLPHFG